MSSPALTVDRVTVRYGDAAAVADVSLDAAAGEIVAILGRNGAGKSSLLRAIMGLVPVAAGFFTLAGRDISPMTAERRARAGLGYVPEGRRVFPGMTVRDNLLAGGRGSGADRAAQLARVMMMMPTLADKAKARAWTLSGGQQQMLAIGRALMTRPTVLLLDEPCLGLAPALVDALTGHIAEIASAGATILLAEQNAIMALTIARRAMVLDQGVIIHSGSPAEIRAALMISRSELS